MNFDTQPSFSSIGSVSGADNFNTQIPFNKIPLAQSAGDILQSNGKILQTERLFTARARYGGTEGVTSSGQAVQNTNSYRGSHAYIKLMTSTAQYSEYQNGAEASTSTITNPDGSKSTVTTYAAGNRQVAYPELLGQGSDVVVMSDTDGSKTLGYDKFLITSVQGAMTEKTQILEVFGDNEVVYYFGRQPMIFNISGVLIDSPDNSWFVQWLKMYSDFLRGTQTAQNYELLCLVLPNMKLTGTIMGFDWTQDAARDVDIPFSFQFITKTVEPISTDGIQMAANNKMAYVDFSQVAAFTTQKQLNTLANQAANLTGVLQDPTSSLAQKAAAYNQLGTATGGGFGNFLASTNNSLNGIINNIGSANNSQNSFFNGIKSSSMFQSVTSSLTGIRMNLFSPIYGILSGLTKLVSNTFNSITGILSAVITPLRGILQDITNISNQVVGLVNLVNSSISGLGRYITGSLKGLTSDFHTAIASLGKAAGAVGTAPITVAQSVAGMFSSASLAYNAPFLSAPAVLPFARPASLGLGGSDPVSKAQLLVSLVRYIPANPTL